MRSITGWRFLFVIALPILLASIGVVALTSDLLNRVSSNADQAENKRNRDLVTRALSLSQTELAQLTSSNAQWDDAYEATTPMVDVDWFSSTWGHFTDTGTRYDLVAVVAEGQTRAEKVSTRGSLAVTDLEAYVGRAFHALMKQAIAGKAEAKPATSFAMTADGPSIVSIAAIVPQSLAVRAGPQKYLVMMRRLTPALLEGIERQFLLRELSLVAADQHSADAVALRDATGAVAFAARWEDRQLGESMTGFARQKAAAALGFLILVMAGITFVCWRLLQHVVTKEADARHAALHDALTEMPNRLALQEHIRELRNNHIKDYTIAFADLDGFKEVNDSYGHDVGDKLLRAIAAGIGKLARGAELTCRMGGDEFMVLFKGTDSGAKATSYAKNMIAFLVQPFEIDGRILRVGASVGIATCTGEDVDELEILRRADVAMYKAKADGKNRMCVYDPAIDVERNENLAIAVELRKILAARTLDVAFQPLVDARTRRISGVEALARWPQTSARKLTADKFIAVAENAGLIDDLGDLILDKACAAAKAWPELRQAINISAVQLNNPRFVERSLQIIKSHGISPLRIEFEITETSLIRDADRAKEVFKELRLAGIKIALDDFGTGFSSIGYLRTYQFDRIKIDKSIISKVLSNPAELAIVQGTLLVARGLSAEVTAEGVEREAEVSVLRLAGCTELQGYFFHMPMSAQDLNALVDTTRFRQGKSVA